MSHDERAMYGPGYDEWQDEFPLDPCHDDSAALAYLAEERQERSVAIIYDCVMRGLSEADARWLCSQCGVSYQDVAAYTQPMLRMKEADPTLDLPW